MTGAAATVLVVGATGEMVVNPAMGPSNVFEAVI